MQLTSTYIQLLLSSVKWQLFVIQNMSSRVVPYRVVPALLLFLATFVNYLSRINFNLAIISIAEQKGNHWSDFEQSLAKGSFYFGYIFFQVPGGRFADSFGTKLVLGIATFVSGFLSLLVPFAVSTGNVWCIIAIRTLTGLAQGVVFPSLYPLMLRWARKDEHGKFMALAGMGGTFGTILIYPICGTMIAQHGWQSVFYLAGFASCGWFLLWHFFVENDPIKSGYVSKEELNFILENRVSPSRTLDDSLMKMISNSGCLAITAALMSNDWGLTTLLVEGPHYLKLVFHKDIATVSINYN